MDIGFLGAFIGGVLTLLSPCSVMLLPALFSFAFANPRDLLARTGVFYLGLITTLVPLGVLAGTLGAFVTANRVVFVQVASLIVMLLGVVMLLNLPFLRLRGTSGLDSSSALSVYALGTVYGLAGVCAGPLLGAVLTLAAVGGNALYGGLILLLFAAGMALPLFVLALLWGRLPFVRRLVRPREIRIGAWRNTWSGVIGGVLMIAIGGLLLVTDGTTALTGLLGASDQARLENRAIALTSAVPDFWVAGVVIAVAGAAWLLLRLRSRSEEARSEEAHSEEAAKVRGG